MRDRLNQSLKALEAALRDQGRWDSLPPPDVALRSKQPFAVDTLNFDQWLQWILLPRLHTLLRQQLPLPSDCAIRPMAEEVYGPDVPGDIRITVIIADIDDLLTRHVGGPN